MSAVKFLVLAGVFGFAYNNSNLFTQPATAWTNSDMITLVLGTMLTLLFSANALLYRR